MNSFVDTNKYALAFSICQYYTLRKMCPYSEFFWSVFSRIRSDYGEILCIAPYSVRMRENTDQNNSEYWNFSRSEYYNLSMVS